MPAAAPLTVKGRCGRRGKELIRRLLEVDPRGRLTAAQALQHDWFTGGMEEDKLPDLSTTRAKLRRKESSHHFRVRALLSPFSSALQFEPLPSKGCHRLPHKGAQGTTSQGPVVPHTYKQ